MASAREFDATDKAWIKGGVRFSTSAAWEKKNRIFERQLISSWVILKCRSYKKKHIGPSGQKGPSLVFGGVEPPVVGTQVRCFSRIYRWRQADANMSRTVDVRTKTGHRSKQTIEKAKQAG